MTSAWSITASAAVPRGAFVDFPLGHTTGKPHDPDGQRALVEAGLRCLETVTTPGTIVDLGASWGDDAWRADPMRTKVRNSASGRTGDSRTERHDTPQYQTDDDRLLAEERHGSEIACRACAGFDD
ncbi:MAG: hypothetical protein FJW83_05880 [Actinobacteria bacterium]|nr:hypothetical protein [Actinomycetota bacterium]